MIVYNTILICSTIVSNRFFLSSSTKIGSVKDTVKSPFAPMLSFSIRNAIGKTKLAEITPECVLRITNKSFKANSNKEEIIAENC